jgi:hypothetical protein
MALAVIASIVFTVILPQHVFSFLRWALPVAEAALLVVIVARDPGRIDNRSASLRKLTITLIALMVLAALWATAVLLRDLIEGSSETSSASTLLAVGGSVWAGNIIAFSLLYWELDSGGPAARAQHMPSSPSFAFPQQLDPEVAPPSWRPLYVDYFYLSFTSAVAFSPTDAMPLMPWAKLSMALEELISLVIFGLVVARAVNVFT